MIPFPFIFQYDDGEPLYKQLYDYVKNEIISGHLEAGDKLPSKRRLAANAKISQNTVETAYEQLMAEGYIQSVPKSGYYVCKLEGAIPVQKSATIQSDEAAKETPGEYQYDFRTNTVDTSQFPFATWARISREIMHDENRELLTVSHPQGDYALRRSIAAYLHEFRGVNCDPKQIVIGAGTEYLLGLIVQIIGAGNAYAVENPGYLKTYRILSGNNANVKLVGLDREGLSIQQLQESGANIVYITPSHQFPLGVIMPVNRRLRLIKWANEEEKRYIIEDDYDSEFRFSGRPIPALQGMEEDKVIYISTFSKSLAPSIRVSYMVLPLKLLEVYQQKLSFYSSTVSRFEQFIICRFMEGGHFERHLNRMRNLYKTRKDVLVEQIKNQFGHRFDIIGENAGLHLLLRSASGMPAEELVERAERAGVKVYNLCQYYIEPCENMSGHTIILGYAHYSREEIMDAVAMLKDAWD